MDEKMEMTQFESLAYCIYEIRGSRVMIDADLARIYGVITKRLNEQVNRNRKKFPSDFVFQLTKLEFDSWLLERNRTHFATGQKNRNPRFLPLAFTEQGAIMAANVLNSQRAIQMSVFVVRAFVKMRETLSETKGLSKKLEELEKELRSRLDLHEMVIADILNRVMKLFEPTPEIEIPKKPRIGFHSKSDG